MAYRKLEDSELQALYKNLRGYFETGSKHSRLTSLVEKYFPKASSILVSVDSEYNDSTYNNSVISVFVYDDRDIEIPLTRESRKDFETEFRAFTMNVPYETDEPLEDFVIYVNKSLPEVYIKEKKDGQDLF